VAKVLQGAVLGLISTSD